MSKQCGACRIVVNELLTFVKCKVNLMDEVALGQIVKSNFSPADITSAKTVLSELLATRRITRNGDLKLQRDVEDIISAVKNTEPDLLPVFVAKDLHKLPPVSFDYIDVTKVLKDIAVLKQELFLAHSKFSEVTVTDKIQLEVQKIKDDISQLRQENKSESVPKGGYIEKVIASSCGTQPPKGNNKAGGGGSRGAGGNNKPTAQPQKQHQSKGSGYGGPRTIQTKAPPVHESLSDEEGFTTVVHRKKKTPRLSENKRGSAPSSEKIKVAPQVVEVFVSQLDPSVTVDNLKEYIVEQGEQAINVYRLGSDIKRKFASFKVVVSKDKAATFLSDKFWPENIQFRQFERRSSWRPQYRGIIVSSTPNK